MPSRRQILSLARRLLQCEYGQEGELLARIRPQALTMGVVNSCRRAAEEARERGEFEHEQDARWLERFLLGGLFRICAGEIRKHGGTASLEAFPFVRDPELLRALAERAAEERRSSGLPGLLTELEATLWRDWVAFPFLEAAFRQELTEDAADNHPLVLTESGIAALERLAADSRLEAGLSAYVTRLARELGAEHERAVARMLTPVARALVAAKTYRELLKTVDSYAVLRHPRTAQWLAEHADVARQPDSPELARLYAGAVRQLQRIIGPLFPTFDEAGEEHVPAAAGESASEAEGWPELLRRAIAHQDPGTLEQATKLLEESGQADLAGLLRELRLAADPAAWAADFRDRSRPHRPDLSDTEWNCLVLLRHSVETQCLLSVSSIEEHTEPLTVFAERTLEAADVAGDEGDPACLAHFLLLHGHCQLLLSDHERALTYLEEAGRLYVSTAPAHPGLVPWMVAYSLYLQALALDQLGNREPATRRLEDAFKVMGTLTPNPQVRHYRASLCRHRAVLAEQSGQLEAALLWTVRSLDELAPLSAEGPPAHAALGSSLTLLGHFLLRLGDHSGARREIGAALEQYAQVLGLEARDGTPNPCPLHIRCMRLAAALAHGEGRAEELILSPAEAGAYPCWSPLAQVPGPPVRQTPPAVSSRSRGATTEPPGACGADRRQLSGMRRLARLRPSDYRGQLTVLLLRLAEAALQENDFPTALGYGSEALAVAEDDGQRLGVIRAGDVIARAHACLGRGAEQTAVLRRVVDEIEALRRAETNVDRRVRWSEMFRGVYDRLVDALYREERYLEAAQTADRSRSRALGDLQELRVRPPRAAPDELRAFEKVRTRIQDLELRFRQGRLPDGPRVLAGCWQELRDRVERFRAQDPGFTGAATPLSGSDILALARKSRSVLLTIRLQDDAGYLFLVQPNGSLHALRRPELSRERLLERLVGTNADPGWLTRYRAFADATQTYQNAEEEWYSGGVRTAELYVLLDARNQALAAWQETMLRALAELWDQVLAPAMPLLDACRRDSGARRLVLVPDPLLSVLPLSACGPAPQQGVRGRCLLDDFTVTVSPTLDVFNRCRRSADLRRHGAIERVLVVSDPDVSSQSAELEVDGLSCLSPGCVEKLDTRLTNRKALCAALTDADVIHFSCHARFDPRAPEESAVLLAGGDTLTAFEIMTRLDLRHTRLIGLLACETALLDAHRQLDLHYGLHHACLLAGASEIWSTLWPVENLSSALLTLRAYSEWIVRGRTPPAALRAAQLWLRGVSRGGVVRFLKRLGFGDPVLHSVRTRLPQRAGPPYAHPYYWAAYVNFGA